MGRKLKKQDYNLDFDPLESMDDGFEDGFDLDELSRDIYSAEWGDYAETEERSSSRRKIERRNDMKRLYSELNDWEEFGEEASWY
jgi:hypothetical protein